MSSYRDRFTKQHVLLPVVHAENGEQTLRNVGIAHDAGADGVFLINHGITYTELLEHYATVREAFPRFWIGINFLDLGRRGIKALPESANGIWTDNAGIIEHHSDPTAGARRDWRERQFIGWRGIYFGGVAFKYQKPEVVDMARVAELAAPFVDVVTTSGPGTGEAADPEKIRLMKEAIGDKPLAIASGITPENISEYLPYADCFLVATGISSSHTELDPSLVYQLARQLA